MVGKPAALSLFLGNRVYERQLFYVLCGHLGQYGVHYLCRSPRPFHGSAAAMLHAQRFRRGPHIRLLAFPVQVMKQHGGAYAVRVQLHIKAQAVLPEVVQLQRVVYHLHPIAYKVIQLLQPVLQAHAAVYHFACKPCLLCHCIGQRRAAVDYYG